MLAAVSQSHGQLERFLAAQAAQTAAIANLVSRTTALETAAREQTQAVDDLQRRLSALETLPAPAASAPSSAGCSTGSGPASSLNPLFAEPSVVRLNTAIPVDRDALQRLLDLLLEEAPVPAPQASLSGPKVGRALTVRSRSADEISAAGVAQRLLDIRRDPWRQFALPATSAGEGEVRCFVDADRSHAERRVAFHTGAAARALASRCPNTQFSALRAAGSVVADWRDFVTFTSRDSDRSVRAHWVEESLEALGTSAAAALRAEMAKSSRRRPRG